MFEEIPGTSFDYPVIILFSRGKGIPISRNEELPPRVILGGYGPGQVVTLFLHGLGRWPTETRVDPGGVGGVVLGNLGEIKDDAISFWPDKWW
jgi:hypothetical protein